MASRWDKQYPELYAFAHWLGRMLVERGWSHRHCAESLGVSRQTVDHWCLARRKPSARCRRLLAGYFLIEPREIPETPPQRHTGGRVGVSRWPRRVPVRDDLGRYVRWEKAG